MSQRARQRLRPQRQHPMLISLTGMDGGGKSSLARALHDAFAASSIRSRTVWMRMGYTRTLAVLRMRRTRSEQRTGQAVKPTFSRTATGWRLMAWAMVACADYTAWLQYVRWRLWCGDVVIADRYLYDFALDLSWRLRTLPWLANLLLTVLRWLAPKPERAYFVRIDPQTSLRRKPADFQGIEPEQQHARYEAIARRYALRVLDGSRPFEKVAGEMVRDVLGAYPSRPNV